MRRVQYSGAPALSHSNTAARRPLLHNSTTPILPGSGALALRRDRAPSRPARYTLRLMSAVQKLEAEATARIAKASTSAELRAFDIEFLGKSGSLAGLMRGIGALSADERPAFGQAVNEAKNRV